ncbi:sigma-70 family RNA polymerase sigma factor [Agrobacterium larrymoorei]|uniref:sigma-70 family RNA polymerase sigma factor n=1 Tax=Agrobacterium larrymoorei TaxID=160699 RepID=UPI0015745265|nr:sigma-70 family RNA polymerase sigma factor [Agrobacterium larrymoorei]NTJ44875.1 sigma-70 family RNA polymerase sigma factor [Agrobacterium larrymoorei]
MDNLTKTTPIAALTETQLEELKSDIAQLKPALTAFARRFVRTEEEVEDLVQETMLRGLRAIHRFTPGTAMKSWLFTIMRNTFCTRYKVAQRERVGLPADFEKTVSTPPSQQWRVEHDDVMRAIGHLDADQKRALLLIADGTSYADAADLCGCRIGTIKSRVSRARETLRRDFY